MLTSLATVSPGGATHRAAGLLTLLFLTMVVVASKPATAVEVTTLYTAQVVLDNDEDDPRAAAYAAALAEVLLRVSGPDVTDSELFELLFPDPAAYVIQFQPGDEDTLWVSFDGKAVEQTLRRAGQTVWGSDRPLTLIWLAVDWGQGRREVIAADDPERRPDVSRSIDRNRLLRQRVLDAAERRGLPVVFPLLDTEDLQRIRFSDIWGGFDQQLLEASARYHANSILVGRIRPASSQRNRWSYYFGDDEQTWNGEPELVIGLVADRLAEEFAISGSAPLETVDLTVAGIDSVAAYGAVQNLLASLPLVESFAITEVNGDRIRYRVDALGGVERLRRTLRFNGLIEQNGFEGDRFPADFRGTTLDFFYSPK